MTVSKLLFNGGGIKGNQIGVELEYCLINPRKTYDAMDGGLPAGWRVDQDGSLGDGGVELVTNPPTSLSGTFRRLKQLEGFFNREGVKVRDSVRAGVHVHINVSDLEVRELFNFMTLYLVMEGVLVDFCGDSRVGNLFCLRATDAYALIPALVNAVRHEDLRIFENDDLRYGSMNVCSIPKYGSLEFRAMKSTTDFRNIRLWVKLLLRVKKAALTYRDPRAIIEDYSVLGAKAMLQRVFGGSSKHLVNCDYDGLMMDGMLVAQDLAFCTNEWEDKFKGAFGKNPFAKGANKFKAVHLELPKVRGAEPIVEDWEEDDEDE